VLVFNLSWLPGHLRAVARTPDAANFSPDCFGPPELIAAQRGLWSRLGWSGYGWCDGWATTDQDVMPFEPDPNDPNAPGFGQLVTGTWGDHAFVLAVEFFRPLTDWASVFPDDPNLAATAAAMHASAGIGVGVINDAAEVVFLVTAGDDIWHDTGRFRGLLVLGWQPWSPWPSRLMYYCGNEGSQQEFQRCLDEAAIDRNACLQRARNDLWECLLDHGLAGGAIGTFLGCVAGGFKSGMGAGAIKALLIACGLGALVGFAVAIAQCLLRYYFDKKGCELEYRSAVARCLLLCPPPSPPSTPHPPLPPRPPVGPPAPPLDDPNMP